ncbi:hypothetical protein JQS43_21850 [Natronosporangium hydrolyticum]|uniref:Uncharacterized protein n=1 Tax=Natronosporangium hydrolyticum TaxID=2811111 RepID=A0A895YJ37_9ACTN|nr:hypothetical protein [Natronosporangium hydrolyticum]QSB14140.1 hypothetical protein JQS43_21850 [Natronosporangium hydrolyticum]
METAPDFETALVTGVLIVAAVVAFGWALKTLAKYRLMVLAALALMALACLCGEIP